MTMRLTRSVLALLLLLPLGGCGIGTRHIFYSLPPTAATPADRGLAFEAMTFPARDGTLLHGWYLPGRSDRPLVLFCEGNATNMSYRLDNLALLHALGLPVFIFDYRGFGNSTGTPLYENDLLDDARGALDLLVARGWTPDRLIYYGQSLGAAVALSLALETPPAGVVLECAFTNIRSVAWHTKPWTYALLGWWSIDARFDTVGRIDRLSRPLLMIHGENDRIAPLAMAQRIFARAPQPKTLLVVAGAGHSNCGATDAAFYTAGWNAFVASLPLPGEPHAP